MLDRFWLLASGFWLLASDTGHMAFSGGLDFRLTVCVRTAEKSGIQVPEDVVLVDFDVSRLLKEIQLGPFKGHSLYIVPSRAGGDPLSSNIGQRENA